VKETEWERLISAGRAADKRAADSNASFFIRLTEFVEFGPAPRVGSNFRAIPMDTSFYPRRPIVVNYHLYELHRHPFSHRRSFVIISFSVPPCNGFVTSPASGSALVRWTVLSICEKYSTVNFDGGKFDINIRTLHFTLQLKRLWFLIFTLA